MRILYLPNEYSQQRQRFQRASIYPVLMAMEATWHRNNGDEVYWGYEELDKKWGQFADNIQEYANTINEPEGLPFLSLPHADRVWTKAKDKKYQDNGNFKYFPATYIQSARDCWYAKCTFCQWAKKYPNVETRAVDDVLSEIAELQYDGFKEVFDDSGTFPAGEWLRDFCRKKEIVSTIVLGCNMRFGVLTEEDYRLMKRANFRMILYGLESGDQGVLDSISKGIRVHTVIDELKMASELKLEPHLAVMYGFPGETKHQANKTYELVKYLLFKGYAKTVQATIYDVPNAKPPFINPLQYVRETYRLAVHSRFLMRKLLDVRGGDDMRYLVRSGVRLLKKRLL